MSCRWPTLSDAPWRALFLSQVGKMKPPIFVLSNLHHADSSAASSSPSITPRARIVVFRGMWASLEAHPENPAKLNPDIFKTHLPVFTTDIRMEKTRDLLQADSISPGGDPGGGGPVEAVFWAAEARTQWRLRGRAYLVGPDIETEAGNSVREAVAPYMQPKGPGQETWSWLRELGAHFGNLSPSMRGTFRNPPPGTPRSQKPAQGLGLGQAVSDVEDELARSNFRVVIIVPDEVDQVDYSNPEQARRWVYNRVGADHDSSWHATELWP